MSSLGAGSHVDGYVIVRTLGQGGMGAVYLAHDETLDRLVAVKVVAPALAGDERFRHRLLHESRLAARLDHPAIVAVYSAGEVDGQLYLAMRYVEGGSLAERLAGGALDPATALTVLRPVADALDTAHAAGLVHRDVKPANILLDGDRALLADFGLARTVASVASASRDQGLSGTLGYLAPEMIEGDDVDGRADQYALACVAFACLTGREAFARDSDVATIYAHLSEPPPRVSAARAELPRDVDAILARGLAKRPRDRYPSCAAFVEALDATLATTAATSTTRRRRRRAVLAASALVATAAVAAGGIVLTRDDAAHATPAANDLVVLDGANGHVRDAIPVGQRPTAVASAPDGVWVALAGSNQVVRVDRKTRQVTQRVATPDAVNGLVAAEGAVWATVDLKRQLLRIDPASGGIAATDVANGPGAIVATPGALWIASRLDGTVSRFDPARGTVTQTIPIGSSVTALLSAFGSIWATSEGQAAVTRIDPATGEKLDTIPVGHSPVALAEAAGSIWIANRSDGTVTRLDPVRDRVVETISVGRTPGTLAGGRGAVWAGDDETGDVYRIDTTRKDVRRVANLGATAASLAVADHDVLATTVGLPSSHRGGTLIVADSRGIWRMDPAINDENPGTWVWDTLVRYRRASGSAGLQLVPDLAETIPRPTDDGRTYTFHVRRNIRYSTGVEVKPSDFVRAIDRLFRGRWQTPFSGEIRSDGRDLFVGLVGGERCHDTPRCDLSKGVVADDAAGTLTFHLSHADAEFVRTVTHTPSAPVPPGTTVDGAADRPVPGTGPYVMASQVIEKELVYRRNPYFRVWAPDARPDGDADVIRWLLSVPPAEELKMVETGRADGAYDDPPARATARLIRLYPNQVHLPNPAWGVGYYLDPRRPPLTSVDVRRAINFAVDRAAVATDAPWYTVPSCQTLLPGAGSFVPYCPYTHDGVAGASPDVARGRALVRSARAVGARVTVETFAPTGDPASLIDRLIPIQRTVIAALRAIGLQVVEVAPDENLETDAMITYAFGFGSDAPDAGAELENLTGACKPEEIRDGAFCDDHVKALRKQAAAATDPADRAVTWTALDHYLTDQAAWLPLGSAINTVFLSKRAGNYGVQLASGGSLWDLVTVR